MAWDSTKVDDSPSDSTNGRLNAVDWNSIVSYVKGIYSDIATHIATYHIANDDARLSNARTPTEHQHPETDITGLDTSLSGKSDTSHNHTDTYEAKNANIQSHISSPHLEIGETETTAYQGYKGQIAYHHALEAHAAVDAISATQKGAASGVVPLNSSSKIDSTYLPAYVDDVIEAATSAGFPETGTAGIIYVALDTNKTYRWSGSAYVEISASLALGETSSTAYAGDKGKTAYDHSQTAHAPSTAEQNVQPDWNQATDTSDDYIKNKPTLGTAAAKNIPATGDASATEIVYGSDTRLSNARTPTTHAHAESDVTGLSTSLSGKSDTSHNHDSAYLGATAKAADSDKLDGNDSSAFAVSNHDHTDTYEAKNANIQSHISSAHLALGETSSTAYAGDKGKTAYDHSQAAHAPVGAEANVNADWNSAAGDSQILNKPTLGGAAVLSVGTTTGTVCAGDDSRLSDTRTPASHVHGNITNAGAIGTTTALPIITTTSGVLTAGSFGNSAGTFCQGNDSRLSDARAVDINGLTAETSIADGDLIPIYDVSASANRKMTKANFVSGLGAGTTTIPCSAYVYVSGSTYYAVSSSGVSISSGAVFSTVLQAVIDSLDPNSVDAGGEIRIASGTYTLTAAVTIQRNISVVFEESSSILINTNVDGFILKNGSSIYGARIDVSGVTSPGYQNTCVTFDGNDVIDSLHTSGLYNTEFTNDTYTGTAVLLSSTSETSGHIYGAIVQNIRIKDFLNGIRLYRTGEDEVNWINGNKFTDIYFYRTRHAIYMENTLNSTAEFYGNIFENIDFQFDDNPTYPAIVIKGKNNTFKNVIVWDWDITVYGPHTELTQYSEYNLFEYVDLERVSGQVDDNGTNNLVQTTLFGAAIPQIKPAMSGVYNNLGTPTIEEMANCSGQFPNQLRFVPPTSQEDSTDGETWNTSTRLTTNNLADLMLGQGQIISGGATIIPLATVGAAGYYRLTWTAAAGFYVFLNAFYSYCLTSGNNVTFTIERCYDSVWYVVCSGIANNWPGHVYIPHDLTRLNTGEYTAVRITFSVLSATYAEPIKLYNIEWYGGYSDSGTTKSAEIYDRNKNVTFPAGITATGIIKPQQAETASAPTYVKGAIYFDTTLNKLRIGGATGWETVSST